MCLVNLVGGAFNHQPEEMKAHLGAGARGLIDQAFSDVELGRLRDYHVHIVGLGTNNSGMWVNPKMLSWLHPFHRLRAEAYLSAAHVIVHDQADQEYVDRLVRLIRHIEGHGKYHALAFDYYYNPDGTINREKSNFYTPNEFVFDLADKFPDVFAPTISVHPYRPDALQELEKWAKRGVRFVKWLPNAQGMNAAEPRNDAYYRLLKNYNLTLLTHVGKERAVATAEDQAFGNPLLFRRPLELGVKIVMAHCGSLGRNEDLDNPGNKVSSFDLFMRLMDSQRYESLLFGDLSAMTQFNRLPGPLIQVIKRKDLHHRLLDGSDYPLPAINIVIQTRSLVKYGLITSDERRHLNEIYDYNPLLFDYVLKRSVRLPKTGERLPATIFQAHPVMES
ncbi:MAG: amidohydrolase family protein [Gammaproteobacteria bacterium]|nr:amidohydrolase family protein [Gammaproteobacteria bacterium]MCI0591678.1 amidohydrolase family protein [Gammaproteobacteria bacterium]